MLRITPRHPVLALCLFALVGCSQNETLSVDRASKLCDSGSGFGARIDGTAEPVEMCVPDAAAVTTFNDIGTNRYYIAADYIADNGAEITIEVSFVLQPLTPVDLDMSANQSRSFADPTAVWFHYRESMAGQYDYVSVDSDGDFRLTVNDDMVAAAWFGNVTMDLQDAQGANAGTRTISEGFVSVIPDP